MSDQNFPEQVEDEFFDALVAGDVGRLEPALDERFLIVDVMSGAVADRGALMAALGERIVAFERIELLERASRHYGDTAIVVVGTEMAGSFAAPASSAASRYTHVFVRGGEARWRLA